jgi:hypothetical protein
MDGIAIVALVGLVVSLIMRARWVDAVFQEPWRTAKLAAMMVSLGLAVVFPLGWAAVVLVSGAMLLEPVITRKPPDPWDG